MLLKIPSAWMAALVLPLMWGGAACQDFPTKPDDRGDGGVADGRDKDAPIGTGGSAGGGSPPGNGGQLGSGGQPGSGGSTGGGGAPAREVDGGAVDAPVDAEAPDLGPPPECTPGMNQCNGPQPQACGSTSKWQNAGAACPF